MFLSCLSRGLLQSYRDRFLFHIFLKSPMLKSSYFANVLLFLVVKSPYFFCLKHHFTGKNHHIFPVKSPFVWQNPLAVFRGELYTKEMHQVLPIWVPQAASDFASFWASLQHSYLVAHPTARKWVITPVINGISKANPLITGVITCYNPLTKWDEPPSRGDEPWIWVTCFSATRDKHIRVPKECGKLMVFRKPSNLEKKMIFQI